MDILEYTTAQAAKGARISVTFETRTLKAGRRTLIRNGETAHTGLQACTLQKTLETIEALYAAYRHSMPSVMTARHRSRHFPLPEDSSTQGSIYGEDRNTALARLETYILLSVMNGSLTWDEQTMGGRWFWRSRKEKGLVISRQWTEIKRASA